MRKCTLATLIVFTVLGVLLVVAGIVLIFESKKIIRQDIEKVSVISASLGLEKLELKVKDWFSDCVTLWHSVCRRNGAVTYWLCTQVYCKRATVDDKVTVGLESPVIVCYISNNTVNRTEGMH